jgi:intein/homing endonuclease
MTEDENKKPKVVEKNIRLAGDKESCGHCILGNTILLGDNKPIQELVYGNQVLSQKGVESIIKTFKHDYKGKLLTIKGAGIIPFSITPEHPLLVATATTYKQNKTKRSIKSFSELTWKKAGDLVPYTSDGGNFLVVPKLDGVFDNKTIPLQEFSPRYKIEEIELDCHLAWLLGLYVAEGVAGHNIRYCLGKHEEGLINKTKRIIEEIGYKPRIYDTRTTTIVNLQSRILARMFAQLCGKGAKNKQIPDIILLHKNPMIINAFIQGYFEGDGNECKVKGKGAVFYRFDTVSKKLIMQLQLLYGRLGKFMAIYTTDNPKTENIIEGRLVKVNPTYHGVINSEKPKAHRVRVNENEFLVPLRKIETKDFEGEVYNIETADTHTYLVSNIVTHNCLEGDKFFSEYAPKTGANYQYYHIESDKGKQIAENLDAGPNGGIPIPAIEYCKTVEDKGGEKKELCDYVEGFNKNDWSDKLDYKKPNDVDDEIDELFGDSD